jgi:hypothetical protein
MRSESKGKCSGCDFTGTDDDRAFAPPKTRARASLQDERRIEPCLIHQNDDHRVVRRTEAAIRETIGTGVSESRQTQLIPSHFRPFYFRLFQFRPFRIRIILLWWHPNLNFRGPALPTGSLHHHKEAYCQVGGRTIPGPPRRGPLAIAL